MSPWQLSVIHIKSQLALKFGQTPKVCGGGEMWLSANGGSSPQSYWLKLKLTTEANGPEKERVTTTDHYTDDILSANWPTRPLHFSQFELRVLGLVTSWSFLVFNVRRIESHGAPGRALNSVGAALSLEHTTTSSVYVVCLVRNLSACNISESYQRLPALNFSPACPPGEVCHRWLGNRKR